MILLLLALGWLCGVAAAALGLATLWPVALLGGAGTCLGIAAGGNRRLALTGVLVLAVALGGVWRYEASRPPEQPGGVALLNDQGSVLLRGVIEAEPEQRERSQRFAVRVSAFEQNGVWQSTSGKVLVTARPFPRLEYGDELELLTRLETPPSLEGFDYREYLARKGISSTALFPELRRTGSGGGSDLVRALIGVRRPLDEALARSLLEPESSLARGILLGQRASIPQELTDDFNRSGISHLVAISGWNVTLVSGYAVGALAWAMGRRRAILAAMVLVLVYAGFVGGSPSVLRAALMGEAMLLAALLGRPGNALTAVVLAGAVLAIAEPLILNDVAFQLSFAATVGIVLLGQPIEDRLQIVIPLPRWLGAGTELMSVTLAATIAVLPIIAVTFGRVSLIALPANLLAVPAFLFVMAGSLVTALTGAISTELGRAVGEMAYLPLAWLVLVGRTAADVPGSSLELADLGMREAALGYGIVVLIALAFTRRRAASVPPRRPLRLRWTLVVSATATVLSVFVWADALSPEDGRLTVTVLDVGQGDAILIETPGGRRLLVDGGPSGPRLIQALGRELPASAHDFDLLVLTHGQDDHVGGLVSVLERYDVASVLAGALPGETQAYRAWQAALGSRAVPVQQATAGQWADLGGGVRLEVLGPPDEPIRGTADELNDNSVVLRLVYGEVSFLLTGDIAAAGEAALLESGSLRSTVLKVAHHGSDGSSLAGFVAAADPDMAVISVGENTYGHPSPSTLLRLAGLPFLRTDLNGRVRFETDGRVLWVDVERGDYRIVPASMLP